MRFTSLLALVATPVLLVTATLYPATSNTKGYKPKSLNCSASKVSTAIQAAECSHNTRVSGTQTFAIFQTDHQYDSSNGAPYGTCSAYTCTAPTFSELEADDDYWAFYWGDEDQGQSSGVGTGCIKDPSSGECGCEDSDGVFVVGSDSCT
ncbi:uncharacterized protein N7473_009110 [Penicillium subrubescens]|uniref:Small secreted protein n=1 Tax=Penicillium subrubescens TaxID=1316194 RepID=A0A1Q5UG92_9EURO|nr:uncharacterized protein N7473_009110 [Penicillium subrubescens]KAJ5886436.1 hypothetical protein N7473_009110 [Penicillium subrubescens]OKP11508.1 hypothetical protein PENSUB_2994 [Penicillium subrubescens]